MIDDCLCRYKQLQYLNDAFITWEKTGRAVPLFEYITSKLEDISKLKGLVPWQSPKLYLVCYGILMMRFKKTQQQPIKI